MSKSKRSQIRPRPRVFDTKEEAIAFTLEIIELGWYARYFRAPDGTCWVVDWVGNIPVWVQRISLAPAR